MPRQNATFSSAVDAVQEFARSTQAAALRQLLQDAATGRCSASGLTGLQLACARCCILQGLDLLQSETACKTRSFVWNGAINDAIVTCLPACPLQIASSSAPHLGHDDDSGFDWLAHALVGACLQSTTSHKLLQVRSR